jgi:O-methyltransferase involved in polyketide biosynthesis
MLREVDVTEAVPASAQPAGPDPAVSHSARIWNYWLGGKDNYAVDRAAGDRVAEMLPIIVVQARADRAFLGRAVRYLAAEAGIRQFLDIGTGLPTADNTHEVAQRVAPESRIVYVDNDPMVLVHARALLTSSPEGKTNYIEADLRNPGYILAEAARTLDLTQPTALLLLGILHHIPDTAEALSIVRQLTAALAPGSFLAINHSTSAISGAAMEDAVHHWNQVGTPTMTLRTPEQVEAFFDGLELLPPGVVSCSRWRPEVASGDELPAEVDEFCGVARIPAVKARATG